MTLADALRPMSISEFVREYLGNRFLHIRGTPERFRHLVTWERLNDILGCLRVDDERVFLVQKARRIQRDLYTFTKSGHAYLDGPALTGYIRAGATLSVSQVDELFPEIGCLAESCERTFRTYIAANLYAAWRTDEGFDRHWDGHDTLVLQVRGAKEWKVWRPTRLHPLDMERKVAGLVSQTSEEPVWAGTLNTGDILYMPRGWWHVAVPRDEASIHVTFGLAQGTGADLLRWMVRQLHGYTDVRMDVPQFGDVAAQRAWVESLRSACTAALSDDIVDRYCQSREQHARGRPSMHLNDFTGRSTVVNGRTSLRLRQRTQLDLERVADDHMLSFRVHGSIWKCHAGLAPALAMLNRLTPCSFQAMEGVLDSSSRKLLRPLIVALVMSEVVSTEEDDGRVPAPTDGY